jgi:hypothetical protein
MSGRDVMPAGAMPPEPEPEEMEAQEPILGKFKSPDELATAYTELEKKLGEQGSELGSMKQMNAMMLEQMQDRQARDQTPPTESEGEQIDYAGQMAALRDQLEAGDISIEDALIQMGNMTAETATKNALKQYEELNAQKQQEEAQNRFLNENPDFTELQRSGQLEAVKKTLPGLHDDFSAYFALKANEAAKAADRQKEIEQIAQGAERTDKVLQKPGSQAKNIGKPGKRLSPAELKAKTLADLEALG